MPRNFSDEDLYTLAGVTLANETVEGYRRQGYGDRQIEQMMGEAFSGGPAYFRSLGREVLGEEIPEQWVNLSRESASRIEAGEAPFEGWRDTFVDRRPLPEVEVTRNYDDPNRRRTPASEFAINPYGAAISTAYKELYAKPKQRRQRRRERLQEDVLARIRAGDPYAEGYAAEVERIGALPPAEREVLASATEGMAADYGLAQLREGPQTFIPGANRSLGSPLGPRVSPGMMPKDLVQEHARRLGAAEARQEIIKSAEVTPAMFKQFDIDPEASQEEKQRRYRERFGDTQISPSTVGSGNITR